MGILIRSNPKHSSRLKDCEAPAHAQCQSGAVSDRMVETGDAPWKSFISFRITGLIWAVPAKPSQFPRLPVPYHGRAQHDGRYRDGILSAGDMRVLTMAFIARVLLRPSQCAHDQANDW